MKEMNLRVGIKKTFESWVLIWEDKCGQTKIEKISEDLAQKLIKDGMNHEG